MVAITTLLETYQKALTSLKAGSVHRLALYKMAKGEKIQKAATVSVGWKNFTCVLKGI